MPSSNPFLDPAFEIRWSQLLPEFVGPAIEQALAEAQQGIDEIAARDVGSVAYENTLLALEKATERLNIAWGKVTHLQSVADSPAVRDAHNAMLPKVSAFHAKIPLNAALWERVKIVAADPASAELQGVRRRYLDETVAEFRQQGADLPVEKRGRLEA